MHYEELSICSDVCNNKLWRNLLVCSNALLMKNYLNINKRLENQLQFILHRPFALHCSLSVGGYFVNNLQSILNAL